ncbi:MAG: glycosyltransferase family 2 protein [Coriobacteriales bacterium]|nr:glycosyltransferase family 2 protein [Coriobacteriales bacterium]
MNNTNSNVHSSEERKKSIPKVSIIIPVYKVEKYLTRCLESVLNQTMGDFELLLVDDGSPDESGAICDHYATRDQRIRVFHQENAGAPAARNKALDYARGKWVMFLDADDWAEPTMLADLVEIGDTNNLELVIAGFYIDTYWSDNLSDCLTQKLCIPSRIYESQQSFRENAYELFDHNQLYSPWNKLYLRSYIEDNNLRFPLTFWDDFPFVLSVIRDIERVGVTEEAYYHFIRAREDSETTRYREGVYEKREEEHTWMLDIYDHWNVHDSTSMEVVYRRYSERLIGCIENVVCKQSPLSRSEKLQKIKQMISTPQVEVAVKNTVPHSTMMRIMLWPIKHKLTYMTYCEGKFVSFVKRHSTHIFAKLKASR